MSYADHLQKALALVDIDDRKPLIARAGVTADDLRHACRKWSVPISAHLRLCAAAGIDPLHGGKADIPGPIGEFHRPSFALALRMKRLAMKWSLRQTEEQSDVAYSVLRRMEKGEPTSAENVLTICKFLKRNPFNFVSRETSLAQKSKSEPAETMHG